MTWHVQPSRPARRTARTNEYGNKLSPRIAVSLGEDEFSRLASLAAEAGKPLAAVIRDAVHAYLSTKGAT